MHRPVDEHQLSLLSQFVSRRLGLHFPPKRWPDLKRFVTHAAPEFGFADVADCIDWLLSSRLDKAQLEALAGYLTIGETYFFREQASFKVLEQRILPELIAARRGREQRLRIWSAGCSTGEEPYSIAILLSRLIPDIRDWHVTILATDINPRAIGKAKEGIYGDWSFRGVPEQVRQRHFTRNREGRYEVPAAIRRMVSFSLLNLVEDPYPSLTNNTNAMDVIFCRNVLMYFDDSQQQQVIRKFRSTLLDGGWLAVSPCEASPAFAACFDTVSLPGAIFYRSGGGREVCPAPMPAPYLPPVPAEVPAPTPKPLLPPAPLPKPAAAHEQRDGADATAPYDEALALSREGRYREAEAVLTGLLAGGAKDDAALYGKAAVLMAQVLANRGELDQAFQWSEKALAVDKLNAVLYCLQATILQERGETDQAVATLKKALYLDPDFVMAHFALGMLSIRQGRANEGRRHFGNALSLLDSCQVDAPVPGAEGLTAGRLAEIITSTLAGSVT